MGKQYLSAINCSEAHSSDILGVEVSKKYTITIGSDGWIKLWRNDVKEMSNPKDSVISQFVNNKGLHHLAILEDNIEGQIYLIIAVVSFDGQVYFYRVNGDSFEPLQLSCGQSNYAVAFGKDTMNGHRFVITEPSGLAKVYNFEIDLGNSTFALTFHGNLESKSSKFATCVDIDGECANVAVGYQNGDVNLFDLVSLKPTYSFPGFGSDLTSTTVRSVKFSPVGKLLAVARDSGPFGSISLHDVYYGETVGTFTVPTHSNDIGIGGYAHDGWCFSLDFSEDGSYLLSGGFDKKIRVWNIETREREATLSLTKSDFVDLEPPKEDLLDEDHLDDSVITALKFISKGIRTGLPGSENNEGICCVGFDRGIRWFREAGGI